MQSALYAYTIFAGAVCAALLAVCLLLSRAPKTEIYRPYDRARKLLGASLCVFAAGIGVFVVFPLRSVEPDLASALNLTYFYYWCPLKTFKPYLAFNFPRTADILNV